MSPAAAGVGTESVAVDLEGETVEQAVQVACEPLGVAGLPAGEFVEGLVDAVLARISESVG